MADHFTIGLLFGIASGIAALLVIAAVTLRRFEVARHVEPVRVHRALLDLQLATRESRDESAASARALRDEIAGGLKGVSDGVARGLTDLKGAQQRHAEALADLKGTQQRQAEALAGRLAELTDHAVDALRDHPMPALQSLAGAQEQNLGAVAADLRTLADTVSGRLEEVRSLLEDRLRQIQVESRDSLEQIRADTMGDAKDLRNDMLDSLKAHTDAKLESILEQRIGDSFGVVGERLQLVSERLEQVHRGLDEVQSFAAGLGNIQRALANVRLGGNKTRGDKVPPAAVEAETGPRAARRKPRRAPADTVLDTVEAPHSSSV
jgi:DNA anti-recombination protein RmuC